jgi:hypothetical protein
MQLVIWKTKRQDEVTWSAAGGSNRYNIQLRNCTVTVEVWSVKDLFAENNFKERELNTKNANVKEL